MLDGPIITLAWECLFPDLTFDMWLLLPFSFVLIIRKKGGKKKKKKKTPTLLEDWLFRVELTSTWLQLSCSLGSNSAPQCLCCCWLIFEFWLWGQETVGQLKLTTPQRKNQKYATVHEQKQKKTKKHWPARITLNFKTCLYQTLLCLLLFLIWCKTPWLLFWCLLFTDHFP